MDKVEVGDCWLWTGHVTPNGYGQVSHNGKVVGAHRAVWMELVGPIPDGMWIDHLCRVRHCVNPDHLEVVTPGLNSRRGYNPAFRTAVEDVCRRGHSMANAYQRSNGYRMCRECQRLRNAARPSRARA